MDIELDTYISQILKLMEHKNFNSVDEKLIDEIASELEIGMRCFIHKETHEFISFPSELDDEEDQKELWQDTIDRWEENSQAFLEIEPMTSHEAYEVMEAFAKSLAEGKIKEKLIDVLQRSKPFDGFKTIIDYEDLRDKWFEFQNQKQMEWVKRQLEN